MLMWLMATEDSQLKSQSLEKENKLCGPENNASYTEKCISGKKEGEYVLWTGKNRAHLDFCAWGGCFVASDWLKKQGIKASHVLSIHYLK